MIYPMMMKVDFQSVKQVGKNPKGLFVTWIVNWLIKPFTMYAISSFFLFTVFKAFITPELATEYLAGAVLLGAAPCTAMVFVWSTQFLRTGSCGSNCIIWNNKPCSTCHNCRRSDRGSGNACALLTCQ